MVFAKKNKTTGIFTWNLAFAIIKKNIACNPETRFITDSIILPTSALQKHHSMLVQVSIHEYTIKAVVKKQGKKIGVVLIYSFVMSLLWKGFKGMKQKNRPQSSLPISQSDYTTTTVWLKNCVPPPQTLTSAGRECAVQTSSVRTHVEATPASTSVLLAWPKESTAHA